MNDGDDPSEHPSIRELQAVMRAVGRDIDDALSDGAARCGPYTLLTVIGEGGYGIVYAAVQDEPVSRRVAIKILKRGLDTHEVLRRFALEQHALGRIDHPAIAAILDSGITADGRPWFAMPMLDGDAITTACNDGELQLTERLQLFADVCDGVQAAHVQGIAHRDLKPANILVISQVVSDSKSQRSVRIIDFGIAKTLEQHTSQTLVTDRPNLGTPQYMAPEQRAGWGDADVRTDVYALGLVLGELVNGLQPSVPKNGADSRDNGMRRPLVSRAFAAAVLQGSTKGTTIARARGLASPAALVRRLRGDIDAVVSKATMHEPHLRYQSADAFAADIRRVLAHQPVSARAPGVMYVLNRAVKRHRVAVSLGALAISVVIGVSIFATIKAIDALRQTERASLQARRSAEVSELLRGVFAGIDPTVMKGRDPELLTEIMGNTAATLSAQLPQRDPVSTAQVAVTLAKAFVDLEKPARAIALLDSVDALIETRIAFTDAAHETATRDELMFERARVLAGLGDAWKSYDAIRRGIIQPDDNHAESFAAHRGALDLLATLGALEDPIALQCAIGLWNSRTTWPEGRDLAEFEEWIALRVTALGDQSVQMWSFLLRRAEIGDYGMILRDYPPVVAGITKALGSDHPRVIKARVRFMSFLVGAAIESRANPLLDVPFVTDDQLAEHWRTTAALGEEVVLTSRRVLGANHSLTQRARLWWLQALGYAQGTVAVRDQLLQLRADFVASEGADSANVKQVDGALRGIEMGEEFGWWWKPK